MARRKASKKPNPDPYEGDERIEVQVRYAEVRKLKGLPMYEGGGTIASPYGVHPPGWTGELPITLVRRLANKFVKPGSQVLGEELTPRATQLIEGVHTEELTDLAEYIARRDESQQEVQKEAEAQVAAVAAAEEGADSGPNTEEAEGNSDPDNNGNGEDAEAGAEGVDPDKPDFLA